MKKTLLSMACTLFMAVSFASAPNEKVLKAFEATFISAEDVRWHEHPDYFDVSFVQLGIRSNVRYDKQGNFVGSTRYYAQLQLPTNILSRIKSKYPDKKIFGVTEIASTEEVNFYVKLEDDKNWITLKINAIGQMQVYEKYKKA